MKVNTGAVAQLELGSGQKPIDVYLTEGGEFRARVDGALLEASSLQSLKARAAALVRGRHDPVPVVVVDYDTDEALDPDFKPKAYRADFCGIHGTTGAGRFEVEGKDGLQDDRGHLLPREDEETHAHLIELFSERQELVERHKALGRRIEAVLNTRAVEVGGRWRRASAVQAAQESDQIARALKKKAASHARRLRKRKAVAACQPEEPGP